MITILFPNEKEEFNYIEHNQIYKKWINKAYNLIYDKVTNDELYCFDKIFIRKDGTISIVTDKPKSIEGYIEHCRSFKIEIDRQNKIVILRERP